MAWATCGLSPKEFPLGHSPRDSKEDFCVLTRLTGNQTSNAELVMPPYMNISQLQKARP